MPDPLEVRLAAERTALSWRRTGLGAVAVAVLLLPTVLDAGWGPAAFMVGIACLLLVGVAVLGYRRNLNLRLHRGAGGAEAATVWWVTATVAGAVLLVWGFVLFTPAS